jgi:hypothetical protein
VPGLLLHPQAAQYLNPHQLGVGTKTGCKSIIHIAQAVLSDTSIPANSKRVLQVDYLNAFNTLDRSHLFKEIREHLPGLSTFVEWSYRSHSLLFFGDSVLTSETGLQQGDPLGPLLFAVGIQSMVFQIDDEVPGLLINEWYLDDGMFVGSYEEILQALTTLKSISPLLGLHLNTNKTTYWRSTTCRDTPPSGFDPLTLGIPESLEDGLVVLGAPVGPNSFCINSVAARVRKISNLLEALSTLQEPQIQ